MLICMHVNEITAQQISQYKILVIWILQSYQQTLKSFFDLFASYICNDDSVVRVSSRSVRWYRDHTEIVERYVDVISIKINDVKRNHNTLILTAIIVYQNFRLSYMHGYVARMFIYIWQRTLYVVYNIVNINIIWNL